MGSEIDRQTGDKCDVKILVSMRGPRKIFRWAVEPVQCLKTWSSKDED